MRTEPKEYILKDDEYINPSDGLVWCRKCSSPRQIRLPFGGSYRTPMVKCSCLQEEWDKIKEGRKAEEFQRHISELRAKGLGWDVLRDHRFENDTHGDPVVMAYMRRLSERFEELPVSGYLLWGPHGTGKTFAAACVVNALIDRGIPAVMRSFPDMAIDLAGILPSYQQEYLNAVFSRRLVCIDGFCIGGESPVELRMKKMIMGFWAKCSHPSIITTSYSLHQLKNPKDETEKEIFGNLLSRSVAIACKGPDLREWQAARRMEEMGRLLK